MKFICLKYPKLEMTYKSQIVREINGTIIKEPTQLINFKEGQYETDDPQKIAFIKAHTDFGNGAICVDESDKHQKASPEEEKIIEKHKKGRPRKDA